MNRKMPGGPVVRQSRVVFFILFEGEIVDSKRG